MFVRLQEWRLLVKENETLENYVAVKLPSTSETM